jgi:TetR/AcrR family tetracycline transcriptional repressor
MPAHSIVSLEQIRTAVFLELDEKGLAALSMRSVASRLGVKAPSLYHHVDTKDALLQMVSDAVARSAFESIAATEDWRQFFDALAHSLRSVLQTHPGAATVVAVKEVSPSITVEFAPRVLAVVEDGLSVTRQEALFLTQGIYMLTAGHALAQHGNVPNAPTGSPQFYDDWFNFLVGTFLDGVETRSPARRIHGTDPAC